MQRMINSKMARPEPLRARQADKAESRSKPENRLEEVLNSAANLFYTKGFHGTTIEDVARDVGMLKGSLYYYIRSKEDLLYQLLLTVIERGDAYIAGRIDPGGEPVEQIKNAIEAQVDLIIENQVRVGLFFHEFDALPVKRQEKVLAVMSRYNNRFVDLVRRGQEQGKFVEGESWLIVNGLLGMCNWIYRWYHAEHPTDAAAVKKVFVNMILKGIVKA
jgi:TetR/AcrR family transcriptional regulator, cholesterol catabolism regulator